LRLLDATPPNAGPLLAQEPELQSALSPPDRLAVHWSAQPQAALQARLSVGQRKKANAVTGIGGDAFTSTIVEF